MYPACRSRCPVPVSARRPRAPASDGPTSFAMPKSRIFRKPSAETMRFSGLRSRCTMPRAVRAREPVRELRGDLEERGAGHGPVPDELAQRPARHELHREERRAVGLADVVDRDDVRVVQGGGGARLVREAREALLVVGEMRGKNLERDLAAEARVAARGTRPPCPPSRGGTPPRTGRPWFRARWTTPQG